MRLQPKSRSFDSAEVRFAQDDRSVFGRNFGKTTTEQAPGKRLLPASRLHNRVIAVVEQLLPPFFRFVASLEWPNPDVD